MRGPVAPSSSRVLLCILTILLIAACGSAEDMDAAATSGETFGGGLAVREASRPGPGQAWVIFGADTVVAEVARTPAERQHGLMDRDQVPEGTGMLFVFENEAIRSFWMKDTHVPLDIAYLNSDLRIVTILQMEPLVMSTYDSTAPAMFALEVRQGWFAEQGIEAGGQVELVFGRQ